MLTSTRKKLYVWLVLLTASGVALFLTLLLLKSTSAALALYGVIIGIGMIFFEPFVGLLNYLVFLYIRPQEYISGLMGLPIMMLISAATAGVTLLVMIVKRTTIGLSRAPQNLLFLWFCAAIIVSNVANLNIWALRMSIERFLPVVMMYFLIVSLASTQKKVRGALYLLLLLTVILAIQGINQYFTGMGPGGEEMFKGRIRLLGIFNDPNDLAAALLIVLPVVVFHLTTGNPLIKVVHFLLFCLISYAIYLTDSRGGFLSYALLIALLFSKKFGYARGIAAGGLALAIVFVAGTSRMGTISTQEASAFGRVESWTVAIDLLQSRPLFGVGAGEFMQHHFRTAHNSILLCAAELGFFGLYAWIMMFYISVKNLFYISGKARELGETEIGFLADAIVFGMIGYLAAAMFLSRTYNELPYILLALATALSTVFVKKRAEKYVLIEKRDFKHGFFISVGSVIFLKVFLIWAW